MSWATSTRSRHGGCARNCACAFTNPPLIVYYGDIPVQELPRRPGRSPQAIDYRQVIGSLVQKPGAFARYRYREALFPTLVFRRA
jgi:hypothetical protein